MPVWGHYIDHVPDILDELVGVLTYKFNAPVDEIDHYRDEIELTSELVFPVGGLDVLHDDPSDNVVLETAILGEADLIVSSDRHLLSLRTFQGIRVLRAAELVRIISGR